MVIGMEMKQRELEARLIAIEYALENIVKCLSAPGALDREKVIRLLREATKDARAAASNSGVPTALDELSRRL
ncbi:hypothetical protein J2X36_002166 [Methylobacterium sp. BE186]|uniref:hypothetical protein n=1 Tax=Methylobacterium sp. BE186 TaxID=2817715 RepID=UPI00285868E1|nr:hypothetical protein [Methylobacterium sp. BE186]MDR7037419.1 hypothetical protein [Methylobacterium sp. BE186]